MSDETDESRWSGWNYRLLRYEYHVPEKVSDAALAEMGQDRVQVYYKIVEVYYDARGLPQAYIDDKNPVELAESPEALCETVALLSRATRAPVLMDAGPDRPEGVPRLVEVPDDLLDGPCKGDLAH